MLDRNDKQWITEILDEKLSDTKTELRSEMQEMKTELGGEMHEMEDRLHNEMHEMEDRLHNEMQEREDSIPAKVCDQISDAFLEGLREQVMAIYENTYQEYLKLIGENVPDKIRSYDRIDEKQQKHQDEIEMLRSIAYSHENRIARLEKAAY